MGTVAELRDVLQHDPRRAAAGATPLVREARRTGDDGLLAAALSVRGRARRALGDLAVAEADLVEAVTVARVAGENELLADAHLGLAGVLIVSGRAGEGSGHLAEADRLGSTLLRAHSRMQRGLIERREGRLSAATASYDRALELLDGLDAPVDRARALVARGVVRTETGALDAAVADLDEAHRLLTATGHGLGFSAAQALHGLGYAQARRGDLPAALRALDRATRCFHDLGHPAPQVDRDRVEVLTAAGLFREALTLGVEVAGRFRADGNRTHEATTWLRCARAAVVAGDDELARRYAERARRELAAQGLPGWEASARLVSLRAGGLEPGDLDELHRLGEQLEEHGYVGDALTALGLAATVAATSARPALAATLAGRCTALAARAGGLEARLLADRATAAACLATGDRAGARAAAQAGLDAVHEYRAAIVSADVRAAVGAHGRELAALGARLALASSSAAELLDWFERGHATRGPQAARPADDPPPELAELRAVGARVREQESRGGDPTELLARRAELEDALRRRQLAASSGPSPLPSPSPETSPTPTPPLTPTPSPTPLLTPPQTPWELAPLLGDRSLVVLDIVDGEVHGVRVAGGSASHATAGPIVRLRDTVETALVALRRAVTPGTTQRQRAAGRDLLARALHAVDAALHPVLPDAGPVVLVVPAELHALPWLLLPSLAGRPVVLTPSVTWWASAASAAATPGTPARSRARRAVAVAGPHLTEADREAAAVAAQYPSASLLRGDGASVAAVSAALAGADLVHLACHGRVRPDNPLWSALDLSDGPLHVYDIDSAGATAPVVVLAGCDTGVGVALGGDLLGLATAFLERGTRTLVASVCQLPDTADTRELMTELHRSMAAGSSAATALASLTRAGLAEESALRAGCLLCLGLA